MNTRVLIAAGLYPPDVGGPATYAALIETELPARGIAADVVPFRLVREQSKLIRHVSYLLKLWRASKGAECVYALDPISVGLPAALVAKCRGIPLILRLGGDYAWEQGQQRYGVTETLDEYSTHRHQTHRMVRVLHGLQRWVARRADIVIVPSHYLKRIVVSWPVAEAKVRVIYSVLSPLPAGESRSEARAALGVSGTVVVTAARLTPWKGVAALIRVIDAMPQNIDTTLLIAGDGPERQALETMVSTRQLEQRVRFLGALDKTALRTVLQASDIFVLNTAYEGLSHTLLEVMDAKVPIVTTNVGGNPELIADQETGLLVGVNDEVSLMAAIMSLSENDSLRQQLVANAAVQVNTFTTEKMMTDLERTIRSVVET